MDKHGKAQIVKAITLIQGGRIDKALKILYGAVGLVYPGPRLGFHQEDPGSPRKEDDRTIDRRKWDEVLNA